MSACSNRVGEAIIMIYTVGTVRLSLSLIRRFEQFVSYCRVSLMAEDVINTNGHLAVCMNTCHCVSSTRSLKLIGTSFMFPCT